MTRGTLLAVDDTPANLVLLVGILERAGYEVRAANSASRALRVLDRETPELLLLDVDMPEMDGYALCRAVRQRPATAQVPVIFVSALDDAADRVRGFEAGGVDFVTKPYDETEVLARVETQLRIHRLQRDLERRNQELLAMNEQLVRQRQKTEEVFSAVSDLLPGRVLDGAFRIDMKIGMGGFGAVYRGTDLRLERGVAIKVLRPFAHDPETHARFRLEGVAACRVRHPNAVDVYATGFSQGVPYLVMELLQGESLWELQERTPKPGLQRSVGIAHQVADALTAAHAAGVIHRDVKPDNIFLHRGPDGEIVKVVDFGIAKLVHESGGVIPTQITRTGETIGTPEYMAPERFLGEPYDASADVYALGVVLFRMLSGERLFEEQKQFDLLETLRLHLSATPRHLAAVAPEVPAGLTSLVMRMLAKDPAERPTSREAASALAGFAET